MLSRERQSAKYHPSGIMDNRLEHLPSDLARHRILDSADAAAFCRFSVPHWRRLYRGGSAPKPVRLSTRKYGWRLGDLIDWISPPG
jgi:predicted DNA-binding transcriptional regulator AlpA